MGSNLTRYAYWHLRDFIRERGIALLIFDHQNAQFSFDKPVAPTKSRPHTVSPLMG